MRIAVISAPKTGNHWIKCLLGQIYDLKWLERENNPVISAEGIRRWVAEGGFPNQTIMHQHCRFTPEICDAIAAAPAHLVTIVRDPYDVFVSLYFWVQERAAQELGMRKPRPRDTIVGKSLDHPDVLAYLADDFAGSLLRSLGWLYSGRAIVVRYEELHRDPIAELTKTTAQIEPVAQERLEAAIEACRADKMRQLAAKMQWHVRSARVGDSRERLSDSHLRIFREQYADQIRSLGYEVR
jgi:hypothetical protein